MKNKKFIENQRKILEGLKKIGPYLGLGTQLAATILFMVWLGYTLDKKFDTYPIFIVMFSFTGCAISIYNFIKSVLDLTKKDKNEKRNRFSDS